MSTYHTRHTMIAAREVSHGCYTFFDVYECARQLKEAGFTEQQAEAQARIMGQAFVHNIDQLVTRDYLDARLAEVETRIATLEARFEGKFRLIYWGQCLTIAAVVLPQLRQFLAG